ncbi:unnamed protein product [Rotaria sordida]|uniref:N-acetyltransferase domain-containing protein n=1 Tax=Rotaria sordida TaxID=392033 RepID=A0A815EF53_9BILA|nr:unnamed protein product [Rotaria sordida]CAF4108474.1 unnamed protein product [Rotaria sordida]
MRICWDQSDEPHVPKPINDDLLHLCHQIFQDPEHEGIYLIARGDHHMIGFASLFWSWPFAHYPGRRAILSDLFVISDAREQARQRQTIHSIIWQTAIENHSAQKAYQQLGITPSRCTDYE